MATRVWKCDTCGAAVVYRPWPCPSCSNETCDACFDSFGHCKPCVVGKSDDELIERANAEGFEFLREPEFPEGHDENKEK